MPKKFMIDSTDEFLALLKTVRPSGYMASLDAESLFTNVPLNKTIDIILNNCYEHHTLEKPKISRQDLKELLIKCTSQTPFRHYDGNLYYQIDGVAMGSPLGPAFANFYMCHVENQIINKQIKLNTYIRYVDDIFLLVDNENEIKKVKEIFQQVSCLKFSYELEKENKISFLDVLLKKENGIIDLSVYVKTTNNGDTINYLSECPNRYKIGAITSLINRAYKICSNWNNFNEEIERLKQVFVNNNYPNDIFDSVVKNFIEKKISGQTKEQENNKINLYYENQMSLNYKVDEKILKDIIKTKTKCINDKDSLNVIIYYKSLKTRHHLIKNNLNSTSILNKSHVVYKITCPVKDCELSNPFYIGQTQNTISRRLTEHLQFGAIKDHMILKHKSNLTRNHLVDNVTYVKKIENNNKLIIYESLAILNMKPGVNKQNEDFSNILKLY